MSAAGRRPVTPSGGARGPAGGPAPLLTCCLALLAAAVLLRWRGTTRGLWYDELFTLAHFTSGPAAALGRQVAGNNHPLASLLGWLARSLGADTAISLRLPSLLAGAAAAPALCWALWPLGRRRAWLAGGLLALAPPAVLASQQLRGYALALLGGALALGAALRCLGEGGAEAEGAGASPRRRCAAPVGLALCCALGVGGHLTLALGLGAALAVWWAASGGLGAGARRSLALGAILGALLSAALLAPTLVRTLKFVGHSLAVAPAAGLNVGPLGRSGLLAAAGGGPSAVAVLAGAALGALLAARSAGRERAATLGLAAWAASPALVVAAGALGYARFLWFAWPAWAALAASAATRAVASAPRATGPSASAGLVPSGRALTRALALALLSLVLIGWSWEDAALGRAELQDLRGALRVAHERAARLSEEARVEVLGLGPGAELLTGLRPLAADPEAALADLRASAARGRVVVVVPLPAWLEGQPALREALASASRLVLPGREQPVLVLAL
ncbi:MAG: hypothetical protein AB7N76_25285 [Planctomycetota bacterium]